MSVSTPSYTLIQLRNDLAANWASVNPILSNGEIGVEVDTGRCKVGNDTTPWNSLPYIGIAFSAGTGISIINDVVSIVPGVVNATGISTPNLIPSTNGAGGYTWVTNPATPKYATTIGDGTSLTYTVTHNLNTTDVDVTVINLTNTQIEYPTVSIPTADSITIAFSVAPTTNQMRVLVNSI